MTESSRWVIKGNTLVDKDGNAKIVFDDGTTFMDMYAYVKEITGCKENDITIKLIDGDKDEAV